MNEKPGTVLLEERARTEEELNLLRYKRALQRRSFLRNVGLAGAGIAAGMAIQG